MFQKRLALAAAMSSLGSAACATPVHTRRFEDAAAAKKITSVNDGHSQDAGGYKMAANNVEARGGQPDGSGISQQQADLTAIARREAK